MKTLKKNMLDIGVAKSIFFIPLLHLLFLTLFYFGAADRYLHIARILY